MVDTSGQNGTKQKNVKPPCKPLDKDIATYKEIDYAEEENIQHNGNCAARRIDRLAHPGLSTGPTGRKGTINQGSSNPFS